MATIRDNLQAVRARIAAAATAAGRDPGAVRLLAVSKTRSAALVDEAYQAGQAAFGENYVRDALEKMAALAHRPLEWHLVGPLQANKTRAVAERFQWVHTLEREKIARRLSEQRPAAAPPLDVLIQVNVSGESTKSGVLPAEVEALARVVASLPRLRLRGLMAIPEPGAVRARYREFGNLYGKLKQKFDFDTLSVGMSDDMELAIAEGSTLVRIGSAIFGARQQVRDAA